MAIPFLGMAVGASLLAGACYVGAKIFGALSKREQRRQQELMDNHAAYCRESNRRYDAIHSQYALNAQRMREQALSEMREKIAIAIAETQEKNRPYYQKQLILCDEQLADVEESIAQCTEMLKIMKESEHKEGQLTALRRNSLRQSRQNFEEAKAYYQSFANYLKRWRKCQEKEFERRGELLEPFSIRLPEQVPYNGKILYFHLSDLRQGIFNLQVQVGITYPIVCEDVTALPTTVRTADETDTDVKQSEVNETVPVLVVGTREEKGQKGNPYKRYVVSYSKGRLMALLQEHPNVALEATIARYEKNKWGRWVPILDYCGVEMTYNPSRGRQMRRKLPKGARLKVYISSYNYNLSKVYASSKLEANFSPDVFHNIPILFEEEDIPDFVERAKKLHLEDSTEDWQIGPFEQDMEEGFRVKCQLGHRFVFVARWRVLPFGDNYHQGLVFERMLEPEDVFHLDDAYVLIDGDLHMQRLASLAISSENVKSWARVSAELYTYLYQEFLRQARIKAGNKEAIYYNHWTRLMNELCQEKEKGSKYTSQTFLVKVESTTVDKMRSVIVSPEEVHKYLTRCDKWLEKQQKRSGKRSTKKPDFFVIVKNPNGSDRRIDICFANGYEEMHFRHDMVGREELEIADGELTVYLRDYPTPEYRQRDALESFRLSDMTNPELKQLFFDLPMEEFSYNGRSHIYLENGGLHDNERQMQAVIRSLSDNALFFIQGPPGTGKTTVIREIIFQELKFSSTAHILVVSQSNVAVDNVLRGFVGNEMFDGLMVRCGNADSIAEVLRSYDFYERLHEYEKKINEDLTGDLQTYRLLWRKMIAEQDEAELINEYLLSDYQIVGVTCVGLANPHFGLSKSNFDLVVIDEAGKAMPGELLLPINRAHKVIIIGDHKQLPPVVDPILCKDDVSLQSAKELSEEEHLQFIGKSLFHRLYERSHPSRRVMLDVQFRMPAVIGDFISKYFYNSELKNAPLVQCKYPLFLQHNLVLIDVCDDKDCYEEKTSDQKGLVNHREADIVAQLVKRIRTHYHQRIVIITPYKRQKKIIKKKLVELNELGSMLNVDTVDSFQGDEAPIVIYCTTRTRYCTDFFSDYARINVAMSRTNNMLFIVASSTYLRKYTSKKPDHVLPALADYVEKKGIVLKSVYIWDDSLDWQYNPVDIENRKENSNNQLSNIQQYELLEPEYMRFLPETDASCEEKQQEENAVCSKCGLVWPITQLTDGMCDICLHYDGIKIKCHACGKDIFFTNYERFILNKKILYYCEECAQLEKNYPCRECGKMIHISPEKHMNFIHRKTALPILCRDCSEKVLDNYLCRQCGKRVYHNANQVIKAIESGMQPFIYCKECGDNLLDKYLCTQCGKRIYHNANQLAVILESGRPLFTYCKDCSDNLLNKYLCHQCGRRIYRNVNQVLEIMKSGKQSFIYCRDCSSKPVGDMYYCCDCGKPFQFTLQQELYIQQRIKERPDWVRPKRCPECRKKKRQTRGLS